MGRMEYSQPTVDGCADGAGQIGICFSDTEKVQIEPQSVLHKLRLTAAPILMVSPFQLGLIFRCQIEREFCFFCHDVTFPGC